jgi:TatD DNase family protein
VLPLIDIGANLTHESFGHDLPDVLSRAHAAGVHALVVTGATLAGSQHALDLATAHPGRLFATAGVHPHHAGEFDAGTPGALAALAAHAPVVAIGECGLDYFRNFSPAPDQRRAFAGQLAIAIRAGKPVFLHQRDAHSDFLAMLREHARDLTGGVAHCFTGDTAQMESYLDLGLCIGITGWICDDRRGGDLREAVRGLPLDRVLLETDAPYLLPRDLSPAPRSRRNEPSVLPHVLRRTATCMGVPAERLAAAAWANTVRLFGLGAWLGVWPAPDAPGQAFAAG